MLKITIPAGELWDEQTKQFIRVREQTLKLQHSLVSISKWEAKWKKPFLDANEKTPEQNLDYIRCMNMTQNVDPHCYSLLTPENILEIKDYIDDPMTATWFSEAQKGPQKREVITSEVIYWQMIALNIPPEYAKWHLNRLLTLIRVAALKNQPEKKMSKKELLTRNAALNAARRAKYNSKG